MSNWQKRMLAALIFTAFSVPCFSHAKTLTTKERELFRYVTFMAQHEAKKGDFSTYAKVSIESLLKRGISINVQDDRGITVLMLAAYDNAPKTIKFLLSKGADVKLKTSTGTTAFDIAKKMGHSAVIALLKKHKAVATNWRKWRPTQQNFLVTRKGRLKTWGGVAYSFRTTDGKYPKSNKSNLEFKVRVTWVSRRTRYKCGQIIVRHYNKIMDLKRRPFALKKCR